MKTSFFKRWAPIVGGLYVSVITILEAFGVDNLVATIKTLGGLLRLDAASPVTGSELTATAALVAGIIIKVYKSVQNAMAPVPVEDSSRLIGK